MTALDDIMVPISLQMITDFGKIVVMSPPKVGDYNPATSGVAGYQPDAGEVAALIETPGSRDFPDTQIAAGDRKLTIAGAAVETPPAPGYRFIFDDHTYTVPPNGVAPIYSGEQVALYQILAKYR